MKKIKEFFIKIFSPVGNFFRFLKKKIKMFFTKLGETAFMQKVGYILGYIPNLIGSRLKNNTRKSIWGIIFVIPLIIGLIYFFIIPLIYNIFYSLSWVENGDTLKELESVGFDNYIFIFKEASFKDADGNSKLFLQWILTSVIELVTDIPIILIFSMILAVVLNTNFRGRAAARAIFFIPVVFNSQAIDAAISAYSTLANVADDATKDLFSQMFNFTDFLTEAKLPPVLVTFLGDASDKIYDIISFSGVQILIFLSAIQSVPRHLYEAAKMEGATQYEMFWKITFPMITPMLLAATVYTVVDSFMRSPILSIMKEYSGGSPSEIKDETLGIGIENLEKGVFELTNYGINAAMSVIFTIVVAIVMAIILGILSKVVFYYDE